MPNPDFKCVFCGSEVKPVLTRFLSSGEELPIVVFTGVPCEKCVNCGNEYFHPNVTRKIMEQAQASMGTISSQFVRPVGAKLITFQT